MKKQEGTGAVGKEDIQRWVEVGQADTQGRYTPEVFSFDHPSPEQPVRGMKCPADKAKKA